MHYIPSSSLPSSNLLFPESRKQNPRCSPHLHRRQRRSTAGLHVPWHLISTVSTPRPSKKSSFCRHRVVDPFFDPGSNLTFTLLVNEFLPKDRTVPSSLTDFSLFFFFTNRENPHFFLFFVCCCNNIWFTIQTYTPYILEICTWPTPSDYVSLPFP